MDYDKLIEQLNARGLSNGSSQGYHCGLYDEAATALSTLQDENAEMQKQLNEFSEFLCHITGGLLSKTNYTAQVMISAAEDYQQKGCGECDLRAENIRWGQVASEQDKVADRLQTENEKLRAELEQAKRERDAAIADWRGFCAKCAWNGKQHLSDGQMDARCRTCRENRKCNWEWRGQKEE